MKKYISIVVCMLLIVLSACGTGKKVKETGVYIYYVNTSGTALERSNYEKKSKEIDREIKRMLQQLKKAPESIDYQSAIPEGVTITGYQLDKGLLRVDFNSSYGNLDAVSEVLCRSAVVQTLTQLKGVESVEFYVDGVPLVNQEGNPIGYMKGSDFIQNTGSTINTYQVKTLQLYFANKNGKQLNKETINVRYNSNMSAEKLIMEQLMKGPAGEEHLPIISPDTKLLGVSVKDRICYVNFDEGFLDNHYDLVPEVPIYAIVNSIIDSGMASQVQISIAGETDVTFKGTISLKKPFERNQEIIEE